MGYPSAIGAMVLDEVVWLNQQSKGRMDMIIMDLGKLERDVEQDYEWLREFTQSVRDMEEDIGGLMAPQAFMRGLMDRMQTEMDALLQSNLRIVETIPSLQAVVHHGQDDPII